MQFYFRIVKVRILIMLEIIAGIALLVIGVLLYLQIQGKSSSSTDTAASEKKGTDASDAEKERLAAEAAKSREAELKKLTVPGCLPDVKIYFGS